jgi:hypothetical protein
MKISAEDAKNHQKRKKKGFSFPPRAVPGSRSTKTEKTKKKQAEAENNELITNTELHPVVFACLACLRGSPSLEGGGACESGWLSWAVPFWPKSEQLLCI